MANVQRTKKPIKVRYNFGIVLLGVIIIFGLVFYRYMKNTTLEEVLSEDREIYVPSFASLLNGDDEEIEENNATAVSDSDSESENSDPKEIVNPVPESEARTSDYLDSCVFIGDSITYGLSSYGLVSSSNVYASVSMSIAKIETEEIETQYGTMTVLDALEESEPENIYVMLGTSGAAWLSVDDMYDYFTSFMKKLISKCPDSEIYIISVPPVTSDKETSVETPISNSDLDSFNELLLEYANSKLVHYLDMNSYLKGGGSSLPSSYAENDGVHLKYSTYELFIDYILTHVAE
ncbi:MAG: GDSL-type esterase/lipase family protein [Oscillospiraceae bacterium]|nr:GDSL-type esterase/lipase family protein [Oscillospiraceae bacterium]